MVIVIVIFTFLIAHCFITVFEMTVDTIFICYCDDCDENDGSAQPYFMSPKLMIIMQKLKDENKTELPHELQPMNQDLNNTQYYNALPQSYEVHNQQPINQAQANTLYYNAPQEPYAFQNQHPGVDHQNQKYYMQPQGHFSNAQPSILQQTIARNLLPY